MCPVSLKNDLLASILYEVGKIVHKKCSNNENWLQSRCHKWIKRFKKGRQSIGNGNHLILLPSNFETIACSVRRKRSGNAPTHWTLDIATFTQKVMIVWFLSTLFYSLGSRFYTIKEIKQKS